MGTDNFTYIAAKFYLEWQLERQGSAAVAAAAAVDDAGVEEELS